MDLRRKYVNDLIPGNSYYVYDNWNLDGIRRDYTLYFIGVFERYYFRTQDTILVFHYNNGHEIHERHIYCLNEFYSLPPPPLNQQLKNQIKNNTYMPSIGIETLIVYMNLANKYHILPHGDFLKYLKKYQLGGGIDR